MPKGSFPRPLAPVVVFVHGGGWVRGDKARLFHLYSNVGIAMAKAGFVGVVMNYRLHPEVHPDHSAYVYV